MGGGGIGLATKFYFNKELEQWHSRQNLVFTNWRSQWAQLVLAWARCARRFLISRPLPWLRLGSLVCGRCHSRRAPSTWRRSWVLPRPTTRAAKMRLSRLIRACPRLTATRWPSSASRRSASTSPTLCGVARGSEGAALSWLPSAFFKNSIPVLSPLDCCYSSIS